MIYVDGRPYDLHKDLEEFVDEEISARAK
jgi:hypothetical protein